MLQVDTLIFNPFQENTYVLFSDTDDCAIVDPGMLFPEEEQKLVAHIEALNKKPVMLLQTHLHLDHVFGIDFVNRQWGLRPIAHFGDEFLINQTVDMATHFGITLKNNPPAPEKYLNDGDVVEFGNVMLEVIHVPGHSPGGIVFYAKEEKILMAGDVLFKGSIGRSDLPGGNQHDLIEGIRKRLLTLPDDVVVYPGHGPVTTIGEEKRTNLFLQ
jgi:hydroxyacylglutathione hydrolase